MGKITFEVTERDKQLLKILIVVLVFFAFYYIAFRPLYNSIMDLDTKLEEAETRKEEIELKIQNLPLDEASLATLKQNILNDTEDIYDKQDNSQLDKIMTQLALKHKLTINNLTIEVEPSYKLPSVYAPGSDTTLDTEVSLMCSQIYLGVTGNKENFYKLLDEIIHKEPSMNVTSYQTDTDVVFTTDQTYAEESVMTIGLDLYMYDKSDLTTSE